MGTTENRSVISAAETVERAVDDVMVIFSYFSAADSGAVDLVAAELVGLHSRRVNRRSTKIYHVEHGAIDFTIDGTHHRAEAGTAVLIRPGVHHEMVGHAARFLIICAPAFDITDEEIFDA
jgi:quercetin dioxygenase-like cupin family protein